MTVDELLAAVQDDRGWPTRDGGYRLLDDFSPGEVTQLLGWVRGHAADLHRRASARRRVPGPPREWLDGQPLVVRLAELAGEPPRPALPPGVIVCGPGGRPGVPSAAEQRAIALLAHALGARKVT